MPKTIQGAPPEIRRQNAVELVNTFGSMTVAGLCRQLKVSPATVRNDLAELERAGALKRAHGGAISVNNAGYEPNTNQKEVFHVKEKQEIARAAVGYICPGDAIALDTGTTTFELAKLLGGIEGLTVVTNDLQIAVWLEGNTAVQIILAGGYVRRGFNCTTGQAVLDILSTLHVDKVFAAANGVSLKNGLSTPNMETAVVKKQLLRSADQVFLLADSSKAGKNAFVSFAPLSQVEFWITDSKMDEGFAQEVRQTGVKLVQAGSIPANVTKNDK
jgi:DeoR family fructose operon transcriptional repressor